VAVSAQRRRRALVAVVAALIAVGAFYLAIEYAGKTPTTSSTASTTTTATPPPVQTTTVVEAATAISQGQVLSAANLKTAAVADSDLPAVASGSTVPYYTSLSALTLPKQYAAIQIPAGTVVVSSMVTANEAAAQAPVGGTDFNLPAGDVALSLPYSATAGKGEIEGGGTGGYLEAGDRIDILVEVDPLPNPNNVMGTMYWAYQNVPVLAVGVSTGAPVASSSASPSASASSASAATAGLIMVQLPRQDAADLAYLADGANVTLQYLIVSPGDYSGPIPTPGSGSLQPVDASSALSGLQG
jgi:Flp pilus assembly protein CpaB